MCSKAWKLWNLIHSEGYLKVSFTFFSSKNLYICCCVPTQARVAQSVSALYLYISTSDCRKCGGCEFKPRHGQIFFLFLLHILMNW